MRALFEVPVLRSSLCGAGLTLWSEGMQDEWGGASMPNMLKH
jgi:hypothetical protein